MKKLTSVILSMIMLLSAMAFPQTVYADEASFHKYDAVSGLGFMSLYPTGEFETENRVSRGEFAEILCNFANVEAETGETQFTDIDEKTLHKDYIYTAVKYNLMRGTGNGLFSPNEFVTVNQVIKTMMLLLGYDKLSVEKGGYPTGYATCASQLGIYGGVVASAGDAEITRQDLACILYNTMNTEILEVSVMTSSGSYKFQAGQKMLKAYHNIVQAEGILEGNEQTMINSSNSLTSAGRVIINGTEYLCAETEASELLGQNVKYYYYDDNETENYSLVWLMPKSNNINTISSENLIKDRSSFASVYYYDEDDEEKYFRLESDLKVIYNGVYYFECTKDELIPAYGDVTLIDNDDDNTVEIIMVNNYSLFRVSHSNPIAATALEKDGSTTLNLRDYDNIYFQKDGGAVVKTVDEAAGLISANDILLLAPSKDDKTFIKILDSTTSVREKLIGRNEEGEYESNKKAYKINPFVQGIETRIIIGNEYALTLDSFGAVVDVVLNDKEYGYLIGLKLTGSNLSKKLSVKLYTTSGMFETFEFAEKFDFTDSNGVLGRYEHETGYPAMLNENGKVVNQLVTYKLNDDKKIIEMEYPKTALGTTGEDGFNLNFESAEAGKNYDSIVLGSDDIIPGTGNGIYSLQKSVMFTVPDPSDESAVNNEKLYRYTVDTKTLELGQKYNLKLYDADEFNDIAVTVQISSTISNSYSNTQFEMFVISGMGQMLDSDGNVVDVVNGFFAGKPVSYY